VAACAAAGDDGTPPDADDWGPSRHDMVLSRPRADEAALSSRRRLLLPRVALDGALGSCLGPIDAYSAEETSFGGGRGGSGSFIFRR
jgi:hypothetical protein